MLTGARQPQTTKHLQVLEAAGVIKVHRLGKRRIASLRRDALRGLGAWLGHLALEHPSEPVLERYERAIDREQRWMNEQSDERVRVFELQRTTDAAAAEVWRAWTTPELMRQWWSPDHFDVADCEIEPEVDRVVALIRGRKVADGTMVGLRQASVALARIQVRLPEGGELPDVALACAASHERRGDGVTEIRCRESDKLPILRRLLAEPSALADVEVIPATLEDIYAGILRREEAQ